jgi:hypothetical protein
MSDPRSADAYASRTQEQRSGGIGIWSHIEPGTDGLDGAVPEGTCAVLAALPAQCNHGDGLKSKVADIEIDDLLHASTGVVQEEKQGAVAPMISGDGLDQSDDLCVFEVPDLWALEARWEKFANPAAAFQVLWRDRGDETGE